MSASLVGSEMCIRDSLRALMEIVNLQEQSLSSLAASEALSLPMILKGSGCLLYTSDAADDM
eukprot:504880-Alexandrium_andersonii.AAC.1